MSDDLTARIRRCVEINLNDADTGTDILDLLAEAADRIERLGAEVERTREELDRRTDRIAQVVDERDAALAEVRTLREANDLMYAGLDALIELTNDAWVMGYARGIQDRHDAFLADTEEAKSDV